MCTSKAELRSRMHALRRGCSDRERRDHRIFQNVIESDAYQNAADMLCYVSFGNEVDTLHLIRHALQNGKHVYVPRCIPHTNQMTFYRIFTLEDLSTTNSYGILEPVPLLERLLDPAKALTDAVCFVPGLVFTRDGKRIGYGKGYYDSFLQATQIFTVGLCYDFQVVENIPAQPHDISVSALQTDQYYCDCAVNLHAKPGKDELLQNE